MDESSIVGPAAQPGSASRFQHLRHHARGGCGEVEVALDRELGREVAYKRIQEPFAHRIETRRRFQFEAEVTGQLEHPSIVPVYSAGLDAQGNPYYAMRLIRGDSLEEVIARHHAEGAGVLEERRLLGHLLAACHAIAYAHSRGVVHRDIKPDNIMVGRFGETFVVDWGLAKRMDAARAAGFDDEVSEKTETETEPDLHGSPVLTQPGSVAGTPAYMSPEQAAGRLDSLGPLSDVYSLGATLYKLLTGVDAFARGNISELLSAIRGGEVVPPRERRPGIPAALDAVCLKAMATEPEDRYQSAEALARDIERWLADEPVEAWREPASVRLRRWVARHRTLVGTSAAAVVVAVFGLGAVATVQARARRNLSLLNDELLGTNEQLVSARSELENANADLSGTNLALGRTNAELAAARDRAEARAELAMRAVEGFSSAVEENEELQNLPELADLRVRLLEGPREFYQAFRDQLVEGGAGGAGAEAATQRQLADVYLRLARLSGLIGSQVTAFEQLDEAQAAAEAARIQDPGDPDSRILLAEIHEGRGGLRSGYGGAGARESYLESLRILEALAEERPDTPDLWRRLGQTHYNIGRLELRGNSFAVSLASMELALEALERALEEAPEDVRARNALVRTHELVAAAYAGLGRHEEARRAYDQALDEGRDLLRDDPQSRELRFTLALLEIGDHTTALRTGDAGGALEHARAATELLRGLCAERPSNAAYRINLGRVLWYVAQVLLRQGEVQAARERLDESIAILNSLVEQHPENLEYRSQQVRALQTLGGMHYAAGEFAAATEVFRDTVASAEVLAEEDPVPAQRRSFGGTLYNLAVLESVQGRIDEALAVYDRALQVRRALVQDAGDYPLHKTDLAYTLGNVAELHRSRGEDERALALQSEARDLQQELVLADPDGLRGRADLARTLSYLGGLQWVTGRLDEAEEGLDQAVATLEDVVAREPSTTLFRRDLATALEEQAQLFALSGRFPEAEDALGQALEILEELCRAHPEEVANHEQRGETLVLLGELLVQYGEDALALEILDEALSVLDPRLSANPENLAVLVAVRDACRARARALARSGGEGAMEAARASFQRAAGISPAEASGASELAPVSLAAWSGDAHGLLDEVERLTARSELPPDVRYELVRLISQALPLVPDAELSTRLAETAIAQLEALTAAEDLRPRQRVQLEHSADFAPLRSRDGVPEALGLR